MDRGTHLCLFVHPEAHIAQAQAAATLGARATAVAGKSFG